MHLTSYTMKTCCPCSPTSCTVYILLFYASEPLTACVCSATEASLLITNILVTTVYLAYYSGSRNNLYPRSSSPQFVFLSCTLPLRMTNSFSTCSIRSLPPLLDSRRQLSLMEKITTLYYVTRKLTWQAS